MLAGVLTMTLSPGRISAQAAADVIYYGEPSVSADGVVKYYIKVRDPEGNPATLEKMNELQKAGKIKVRENGLDVQNITLASDGSASSVVILLDTSNTMKELDGGSDQSNPPDPTRLERAQKAAAQFIRSLDESVQVAVMTFNDVPIVYAPFGTPKLDIIKRLEEEKIETGGNSTCIKDTIVAGLDLAKANSAINSQSILLITDGNGDQTGDAVGKPDEGCSTWDLPQLIDKLKNDVRAQIFTLAMVAPGQGDIRKGANLGNGIAEYTRLATETGGALFLVERVDPLSADPAKPDPMIDITNLIKSKLDGRFSVQYRTLSTGGRVPVSTIVDFGNGQSPTREIEVLVPPIPAPPWSQYVLFGIGAVAIATLLLTLFLFLNRGRGGVAAVMSRKPASVTKGEPLAQLIIVEGPGVTKPQEHFLYGDRNVGLGRDDDMPIQLPGERVSRQHGEILYRRNQFLYSENKATNGTDIDGQRVAKDAPVPLRDGCDIIFAGQTRAIFRLRQPGAVAAQSGYIPAAQVVGQQPKVSQVAASELHTTEWVRGDHSRE
jgi:hypothetical protein